MDVQHSPMISWISPVAILLFFICLLVMTFRCAYQCMLSQLIIKRLTWSFVERVAQKKQRMVWQNSNWIVWIIHQKEMALLGWQKNRSANLMSWVRQHLLMTSRRWQKWCPKENCEDNIIWVINCSCISSSFRIAKRIISV